MDATARHTTTPAEGNQAYVRELLRLRQPAFAAALEAAVILADAALSQAGVTAG